MATILVTGGSGFLASHCLVQLALAGHRLRATLRNPARGAEVRALLKAGGAEPGRELMFYAADLMSDDGWSEAANGCDFVLHVASPFPVGIPKNDDELIVPARDGALRVLRAARAGGVKRVVLTSSFAAIGYGHPKIDHTFTEKDWTDPTQPGCSAYVKSKTIAERAAWDFVAREGGGLELATVNPVGIFGPLLGPDFATSILLVQRLLDGAVPGCPKLSIGAVDVRDVADLHVRAMSDPAAKGERFLAVAGDFMSVKDMALVLKARLGAAASRVPTHEVPNWVVRLVALFDRAARQITPELGVFKNATSAKARELLRWSPRSREDALVATAVSLEKLGLLKTVG
jgi:nucleoside-diphosphate-sugar epimerase